MAVVRLGGVLFICFFAPAAHAKNFNPDVQAIYYDLGEPDRSVAVIEGDIMEHGQWIGPYRILRFEPESVVFEDRASGDRLEIFLGSVPAAGQKIKARDFFMVKQMRAIYQAQTEHFHRYGGRYAPQLNDLIDRGFLDGGFQGGVKAGYHFEIRSTGQTPEYAYEFEQQPTYTAVARPVYPVRGDRYFLIDHLGALRFSDKEEILPWSPVWDYEDHLAPDMRDVGVD